jgi:hypothetical protein
MVKAHQFFGRQAREWLHAEGPDAVQTRALAIEMVVRERLQIVVIDLTVDENAQEIFETLNARGAQLTAADLIKNFIFQRLLEKGANVEQAYQDNWKEFETGFWETETSVGRLKYPRAALFLNHWLVARTGEEVVAREVFDCFKTFADHDANMPMSELLRQIHAAANIYRSFVLATSTLTGPSTRLGLFGYRTGVLESEVIKPLILCLLDPEQQQIPELQFDKALDVVESWMVRRMLVRATTKNYNQVMAEIVALLYKSDRAKAGDEIEKYIAGQTTGSRYWPDDAELKDELGSLLAYRRLGRGRLRMVLEAVEDYLRGWKAGQKGLGEERVARGKFAIEHVMPRRWQTHWPIQGVVSEGDRDRIVHTFGNLTLLTGKLNSKVSNGPWIGDGGKRAALEAHDVLLLNRDLLKKGGQRWSDDLIRSRTEELIRIIIDIWKVPPNHQSGYSSERMSARRKVDLSDLITGGALTPGMSLFPRRKKYNHQIATLLPDGKIELDGVSFARPSDAASAITGKRTNGWWFFLADQASELSLRAVRRDYIDAMAVDADDEDQDDDDGDDD